MAPAGLRPAAGRKTDEFMARRRAWCMGDPAVGVAVISHEDESNGPRTPVATGRRHTPPGEGAP
jgi:hypothetical protein